jgi:bacteriocin-associated integral membrane protein
MLLLSLFFICSISLANSISNDQQDAKIMRRFEQKGDAQLNIPSKLKSESEYQKLLQIIEDVSKKTGTSFVLRSLYMGNENDGNGKTSWEKGLLKIENFQSPFTSPKKETYFSHGQRSLLQNFPLSKISYEQFENAALFVGGSKQKEGIETLVSEVNAQFSLREKESDWQISKGKSFLRNPEITYNNANLTLIDIISLAFFFIFLLIWLVQNSRRIAIYKLNGLSAFKIANRIFLHDFIRAASLSLLAGEALVLRELNLQYLLYIAGLSFATILIAHFSIWMVTRFSLINQINHKSLFRYSYIAVFFVKILLFLVGVTTMINLTVLVNQSFSLSGKQSLKNYGILYAPIVAYSLGQNLPAVNANLFDSAEKLGAIHSEEKENIVLDSDSRLTVSAINANYLLEHPISDLSGQTVQVSHLNENGLVFVAKKWKMKISELRAKISHNYGESFAGKIQYVFIKDNQKIQIWGHRTKKINADICLIYTSANAGPEFTRKLYGYGNPYSLLIPIRSSLKSTYRTLIPALKRDNTLSQYPSFISAAEVPKVDVMLTIGNPVNYIFMDIFVFFLFISMIIMTSLFYFRAFQRQIAIKRLQGFSLFRAYRHLFLGLIIQYSLGFIVSLSQEAASVLLETLVIVLIVETLVIIRLIRRLSKSAMLAVLKGEN